MPLHFSSTPFIAVALRYPSTPLPSSTTRLNALALLYCSVPTPLIPGLNYSHAGLCTSFASQRKSLPSHCFSCHCLCRSKQIDSTHCLGCAIQCLCGSLRFSSRPCQCNPGLRFSRANPVIAIPTQLQSLPCRRGSLPSMSSPCPRGTSLFIASAKLCVSNAVHSLASATQNFATQNFAIAEQLLTLPPQFQADRIYAVADHSLSMPLLFLTQLCLCFTSHPSSLP